MCWCARSRSVVRTSRVHGAARTRERTQCGWHLLCGLSIIPTRTLARMHHRVLRAIPRALSSYDTTHDARGAAADRFHPLATYSHVLYYMSINCVMTPHVPHLLPVAYAVCAWGQSIDAARSFVHAAGLFDKRWGLMNIERTCAGFVLAQEQQTSGALDRCVCMSGLCIEDGRHCIFSNIIFICLYDQFNYCNFIPKSIECHVIDVCVCVCSRPFSRWRNTIKQTHM